MIVAFLPSDASAFTASPVAFSPNEFSPIAFSPIASSSGAVESCPLPPMEHEQVRHLVFGSLGSVRGAIAHLHALGYAEPNDWSRPISTGRANEVMAILTKRVSVA